MFSKKWDEASKRMSDYHKDFSSAFNSLNDEEQEKEYYKFCILSLIFIICNQYIDLNRSISFLMHLLKYDESWKNIIIKMFLYDILKKILNKYYDKEQIEIVHKEFHSLDMSVEKIKDGIMDAVMTFSKIANRTHITLEEKIGTYFFNKFQSN